MNICSVKADFVSCWMKIDASSRLSRGCFFDVNGCYQLADSSSHRLSHDDDRDPADQTEGLQRIDIVHHNLQVSQAPKESRNQPY